MAWITRHSVDDVYKQINGEMRTIRSRALALRTQAAAGPVSFTTISAYLGGLTDSLALVADRVARYDAATLAAYAKSQHASADYNPAQEYAAVVTAANAVATHISLAIPANSAHSVTGGQVVEPSFSTAQTAALRALLDTLIGTIGAP